jgi:beta-lactamase class D
LGGTAQRRYFKKANVNGCFLLYDLKPNKYIVYNLRRANTPFIPASTYKIFNSLVALETRVVRDENEVIKWNGVDRGHPEWNQDLSLRSAIKYSAAWFYQDIARRITEKRMQHHVNLAQYGNRNISGGIDHFWIDGALRITPKEQIDLLVRLYQNKLPFSQRTMDIVRDILINEKTDRYILRAKTGWGAASKPQVGWWVGYVENGGDVYFFACNIDIDKDEDAKARKQIAETILRDMNIIS